MSGVRAAGQHRAAGKGEEPVEQSFVPLAKKLVQGFRLFAICHLYIKTPAGLSVQVLRFGPQVAQVRLAVQALQDGGGSRSRRPPLPLREGPPADPERVLNLFAGG